MTSKTSACNQHALLRMLDGVASPVEDAATQLHLESCAACCESLDSITGLDAAAIKAVQSLTNDDLDLELGDTKTNKNKTNKKMSNPASQSELSHAVDSASDRTSDRESTDESQSIAIKAVLAALAPTDDPRMLGRFGGYEILGVIGCGGTGVVLKGFEPALNRYVAIKVLAPHLAISATARQRFARESRATASVLHPNVVPVFQVAEADGFPFLVMPYLGSETLQKRMDDYGWMEAETIIRVGMQIASGLAAAHAQGLVHRDIKPANILLDRNTERVVVTDFGLARTTDDANLTMTGIVAGTPPYMSPEQAQGETLDGRSDLFCLGSVMYAMCTGGSPFQADNSLGTLRRVTDDEPRPIRDINPQIPDWLAALIGRLQSKQQCDRFQTADEVAELLKQCLGHLQQPLTTPLPKSLRHSTRSKKPLSISLFGVAMFVLLATGLISILTWMQTEDWTNPVDPGAAMMNEAFIDSGTKMSVARKLQSWKEMAVGSDHEKQFAGELLGKYREHLAQASSETQAGVKSRWAVQLLPFALGGVPETKAELLHQLSRQESTVNDSESGMEMQVIHALACARRGFTDDATNEINSAIATLEERRPGSGQGSDKTDPIEFFGKLRTIDEILHECYGYRAVIRSINVQTMERPDDPETKDPGSADDGDGNEPGTGTASTQNETTRDPDFFSKPQKVADSTPFHEDMDAVPDRPSLLQADENFLSIFEVDGNQFVSKATRQAETVELGAAVWKRITKLFPLHYRREIVQFNIQGGRRWAGFFSGGGTNDVGREGFRLSIAKYTAEEETNLKTADRPVTSRRGTLDWTLVHEIGHYVCLRSDAIELFSQRFDGNDKPQPERRENPTDYPADGSPKLVGNFVTSYAERTPGDEEVVETFTTYITIDILPEGDSLVEKKIRFFEDLPGFPALRAHVQGLRDEAGNGDQ